MLEEQTHAIADSLQTMLGINDLQFDEGALVARSLLGDLAQSGQDTQFSLGFTGADGNLNHMNLQFSAEAAGQVRDEHFTWSRIVADHQSADGVRQYHSVFEHSDYYELFGVEVSPEERESFLGSMFALRQRAGEQFALADRIETDPDFAKDFFTRLERGDEDLRALVGGAFDASNGTASDVSLYLRAQAGFANEVAGFGVQGVQDPNAALYFDSEFIRDSLPLVGIDMGARSITANTVLAHGLKDPFLIDGLDGLGNYRELVQGLGLNVADEMAAMVNQVFPNGISRGVVEDIPYLGTMIAGIKAGRSMRDLISEGLNLDPSLGLEANFRAMGEVINASVKLEEALESQIGRKFRRLNVGGERRGESGMISHGDVGEGATRLVFEMAQQAGLFQDVASIQGRGERGHGIDLMAKHDDEWYAFEVKTSRRNRPLSLSNKVQPADQRDGAHAFATERLSRAARNEYGPAMAARAEGIQRDMQRSGQTHISGYVVQITGYQHRDQDVQFYRWEPGHRVGREFRY